MPTPEDLLIFKIVSGRDKDLLDAVSVARRHADRLDWGYVTMSIDEICELADQAGPRELLALVRARAGARG